MLKRTFFKFYHRTYLGNLLRFLYHWSKKNIWSDKMVVKHDYKRRMGKNLNLTNPTTLNEKINWLKLYDRRPIHTTCADKFEVRNYIKSKIGEEFLIPLVLKTENPEEITPNNLPEFPVAIKTNHDSGGAIIVRDKNTLNYKVAIEKLRKRLKKNYYKEGSKEWQYKNIKPLVVVEKLLLTKTGTIPMDYKVHCFNGKAHMIQVDMGRDTDNHQRNWYYSDWTRCPFKWTVELNGRRTDPADFDIPPPTSLVQMLEKSNVLAKPFDYVRVDWYDVDGQLYFGEITFHHDGGSQPILPEEWDTKLGQLVELGGNSKSNLP